jgi:hypothetical protein
MRCYRWQVLTPRSVACARHVSPAAQVKVAPQRLPSVTPAQVCWVASQRAPKLAQS